MLIPVPPFLNNIFSVFSTIFFRISCFFAEFFIFFYNYVELAQIMCYYGIMKRIKYLKWKIIFTLMYTALVFAAYYMHFPCIYLTLFGVPCPGCGMTRALVSAVHLNVTEAAAFHPMFWSVPICFLYFLFDGKVFNRVWIDRAVLILIAIGFVASYIIKIIRITV